MMSWANTDMFPTPYDGNIDGYNESSCPPIAFICDDCGGDIYDGDDYYEINEGAICSECISAYRRIAYA